MLLILGQNYNHEKNLKDMNKEIIYYNLLQELLKNNNNCGSPKGQVQTRRSPHARHRPVVTYNCNVLFQKLSTPPPRKGFFLRPPPHLSGNSSQASYMYLNFWAFENPLPPPPPRNFQSPRGGGSMDISWHYTISITMLLNSLFYP